jgi:hypothetical protein
MSQFEDDEEKESCSQSRDRPSQLSQFRTL